MTTPEQHLYQYLQLPGVTEETRAVFLTLLARCAKRASFSVFVLDSIIRQLDAGDQSNDHLADALNEEASRWLADFLTIAVGRRECYGSTSASHPYGGPRRRERPWSSNGQLVQTLDLEVFLRDGQKCSVSGSTHSLVCVQLIPTSEDTDRLSRFRRLARAFFDNDLPCIEDPVLRSTENAMLVTCFWKDRLDSGFLTFNSIDKELHATPMSMSDSDLLDEERRLNGVQGPTLLQLCGGVCQYPKPVNQELAKVHHTIIGVLRETGTVYSVG